MIVGALAAAADKAGDGCSSTVPASSADPEIEVGEARVVDILQRMNGIDNHATSKAPTVFFKTNSAGGDIKITDGVTKDALIVYRELALEAMADGKGNDAFQKNRIDLIERALEKF